MYTELLQELELLRNKIITIEVLDDLFNIYDWKQMGINRDLTKLTYIEGPMDKQIDLGVELFNIGEENFIVIREINKKYWED